MKVCTVIVMAGLFFVTTGLCSEKNLSINSLSPKQVSPDAIAWFDTQIAGFTYGIPSNVSQPQGALVKDQAECEQYFTAVQQEFAHKNNFSLGTDQSRVFYEDPATRYLLLQNNRCAGGIMWAYIVPTTPNSSSLRKSSR